MDPSIEPDADAVVGAIAQFALAHGGRNIAALPGPWAARVDTTWWIAINGQATPQKAAPAGCMAVTLAPYEIGVWYYGFLAGTFAPTGEGVFAAGTGANLGTFLEALRAATPPPTGDLT